ncbi:MAG: hypothetical protein FJY29_10020 [Betaproteobacteria bacterium]|nr:hypothetical protein [Betaproteobacteria bacterium]
MFGFSLRWGNQRGTSTTSILVFTSVLALSSGAVIQSLRDNRKARTQETAADVDRRVNETALQSVTQLITNGSLYFNSTAGCRVIEPQINGNPVNSSRYTRGGCLNITTVMPALDCANANASWRFKRTCPSQGCEVVDVCVPVSRKDANGVVVNDRVLVEVKFVRYPAPERSGSGDALVTERNFAFIKAQRPRAANGTYFSSLEAKVNLGAASDGNRGLLGRYGAADTCFYMRPQTVAQSASGTIGFAARGGGRVGQRYVITELEPRPDGNLADEFEREIPNLAALAQEEDYAVLAPLRERLIPYYMSNDPNIPASQRHVRGGRAGLNVAVSGAADSWRPNAGGRGQYISEQLVVRRERFTAAEQANSYFVGVTPKLKNVGGPEFKYYLTGSKSQPVEWLKQRNPATPNKSPQEWYNDYKSGCGSAGSTGAGADFCTKVYVPREHLNTRFNARCVSEDVTIEPVTAAEAPNVKYADRALQVSCSDQWVQNVRDLVRAEEARLNNKTAVFTPQVAGRHAETTLQMAIAALEVDDAFIAGRDRWANNPVRLINRVNPTAVPLQPSDPMNHPLRHAFENFKSAEMQAPGASFVAGNPYAMELRGATDKVVDPDTGAVIDAGTTRTFKVYRLQALSAPVEAERYTSQTCAYFVYKKAEDPRQCSYTFITRDQAGFVCRNNDGCFDESTRIRMADGSDRLITQLKMGEFVFNPVTKLPAKITKLTIGPELKHLLNVRVGDRVVKVTDSHPFMTRRGWVQAKDLKKGVEILRAQKAFLPVQSVELGEFGRTVVNLALEGPADYPELHYVLADGVVTGDLVIQNMLQLKASSK